MGRAELASHHDPTGKRAAGREAAGRGAAQRSRARPTRGPGDVRTSCSQKRDVTHLFTERCVQRDARRPPPAAR
ncbi:hypothetical protein [Streptomyces pactum]|uniref:Uncharacterized protein n=1 Tax=Streptomyces pactum TaxID=68249 RepID=A0A1S6JH99_9ACTN|nr:hypothetical protein [Streptomyces pactum]AQS71135.1 hypothetical protein B1H29_33420 [Streptomyces pactum]